MPIQIGVLLVVINSIVFLSYGFDKYRAVANRNKSNHNRRISERTLIIMALIGPLGGFLGMIGFRHKTRKMKFKILIPLFLILQLTGLLYWTTVNAEETRISEWAISEVQEAIEKGLITGELDSQYTKPISRRQFIELIVSSYEKVFGEEVTIEQVKNPYADTDSEQVIKAHHLGIVKGVEENLFRPEAEITREQLVVIIQRLNDVIEKEYGVEFLSKQEVKLDFKDRAEVATWAVEGFKLGVNNKIISGSADNYLQPKQSTTTEQTIIINLRLMKIYEAGLINLNNNQVMQSETTKPENKPAEKTEPASEVATDSIQQALQKEIGIVMASVLNMRQTPDLSNKDNIIHKLSRSERVVLLSKEGSWYKVNTTDGLEGYVHSDYINVVTQEQLQAEKEAAALLPANVAEIIAYAKQFIGTRYVYGGNSLTKGTDCSGYTGQVFAKFGISLARSSRGQYSNGKAVSLENIRPGDLIFYGWSGKISHVALYIGDSQVIHANTTYGVSITPAFGWMHKPVIGARRVISE